MNPKKPSTGAIGLEDKIIVEPKNLIDLYYMSNTLRVFCFYPLFKDPGAYLF